MKINRFFFLLAIVLVTLSLVACSSKGQDYFTGEEVSTTSKTIDLTTSYTISKDVAQTIKNVVVPSETSVYPITVDSDGKHTWINPKTDGNAILFNLDAIYFDDYFFSSYGSVPGDTSQFDKLPSLLEVFWKDDGLQFIFQDEDLHTCHPKYLQDYFYDDNGELVYRNIERILIDEVIQVNADGEIIEGDPVNCIDKLTSITQKAVATFSFCNTEDSVLDCHKENLSLQLSSTKLYFTIAENVSTENREEIVELLKYKGIDTSIIPDVIMPGANYEIDLFPQN